jgi:hypothetical protein
MRDVVVTPYVPNCACPLLFESEFEGAPYGMSGTGFLLRSNSRFYFITAKHSLELGDHDKLRVPRSFGSTEFLELGQFGHPVLADGDEDTDWADLAAFSVVPTNFGGDADSNALEPAFLPNTDTRHLLKDGIVLTVRGYPASAPQSGIDYGKKRITVQALNCDATFLGLTESQCCYELRFVASCPIDDFNFMSGSPVFAKLPYNGSVIYVLVGALLRAGGLEKRGRFVSIEVFKRCRDYYSDPTEGPNITGLADRCPP